MQDNQQVWPHPVLLNPNSLEIEYSYVSDQCEDMQYAMGDDGVMIPEYVGDGWCDDHLNHLDCFFDGGDCCYGGDQTFCVDCECHHYSNTTNLPATTTPPRTNEYLIASAILLLTDYNLAFQLHSVQFLNIKVTSTVTMKIMFRPVTMTEGTAAWILS